jgi:hypothetical protein
VAGQENPHRKAQAKIAYEVEAQAMREKSARLRALRLAKEAAELGDGKQPTATKAKNQAEPKAKAQPLAEWLKRQEGAGRRS